MPITAKLDDLGPAAWIALTVLAFFIAWPVGLAILAYIIWSGRMACWSGRGFRRGQNGGERVRDAMNFWQPRSSGNRAFDEYRNETLKRLEDEQREFREFLERLRAAKDKTEFDQFMADRRGRNGNPPSPQPQY